jgi:hypothetical protein
MMVYNITRSRKEGYDVHSKYTGYISNFMRIHAMLKFHDSAFMLSFGFHAKRRRITPGYKAQYHSSYVPPQASIPVRGLSRRFSYSHLLFNPTLALPVDGVGVPGAPLDELSPNKLLS